MTGAVSAYYRLAYNLYLIAHNGTDIQTRLLSRLQNHEHFHGAFFETGIGLLDDLKAGFELEFENESDRSTSHCEFTATYPSSTTQFSVEAKSRFPGKNNQGPKSLNVGRQLRLALEKQASSTELVFLDLNHPITSEGQAQRILNRAEHRLKGPESGSGLAIEHFAARGGGLVPLVSFENQGQVLQSDISQNVAGIWFIWFLRSVSGVWFDEREKRQARAPR